VVKLVPEVAMIAFNCASCGKDIKVKDEFAGRQAGCPQCKKVVTIPSAAPILAEAPVVLERAPEPSGGPFLKRHGLIVAGIVAGVVLAVAGYMILTPDSRAHRWLPQGFLGSNANQAFGTVGASIGTTVGPGPFPGVDPRIDRAKIDVVVLEQGVQVYKVRHGELPPTLRTLTEPGPSGERPTLEAQVLTDPWNRPYKYEPNNLHPLSGKPRIYSEGPNPGQPRSRISNWE
jgi:hypothetical protein